MAKRRVCKKTDRRNCNELLKRAYSPIRQPKRIRTDPATIFRGETLRQFCSDHFIKHIECPNRDHRGNEKIERLIRTLNERLRADKTIITERGNAGLARLLFALRTAAAANKSSLFEQV